MEESLSSTFFIIRPGKKEDVPHILALVRSLAEYERLAHLVVCDEAAYLKYGFGPQAYFQTLLVESVSVQPSAFLGFALYFFTFSTFLGKPTLYLEDLFVLPQYRQRGIGKSLLRELAKIAVEKDCGRMEWSVLGWNQLAIDFYEKLGAKPQTEWTLFRLEEPQIRQLAGLPTRRESSG
ncbi:MAG: GNAT family N-acetyltransferase [Calditrichia bacterium]